MTEFEEKEIEQYNEEIIERGEQIYQKYIDAGYSSNFASSQRDNFININKM